MDELVIDDFNTIAESTRLIREMFGSVVSKREFDLIYSVISCVKPEDTEFKQYKITHKQIAKIFNPANPRCKATKKDVENAINSLMSAHFTFGDMEYHWVETCQRKPDHIIFKLSNDVRGFYLDLHKGKTVYLLADLLSLSTIFQANLFRYLTCNSNFNNDIKISPQDMKLKLANNDELRTDVLTKMVERAVRQINEKTQLNVEYKIERENYKKIKWFVFDITNNYEKLDETLKAC